MKVAVILTLFFTRSLAFVSSPAFRMDRRTTTTVEAKPEGVKDDKGKNSDEKPGDGLDLDLSEMFDM